MKTKQNGLPCAMPRTFRVSRLADTVSRILPGPSDSPRRKTSGLGLLLLVGAVSTPHVVFAQTRWQAAGTSDWFSAPSWSQGVPTAGTDALISNGATAVISTPGAITRGIVLNGSQSGLTILGGGTLASSTSQAASGIGIALGSFAIATVDGPGSRWTHTGRLNVGIANGIGMLDVVNGGALSADSAQWGAALVNVQGAGSTVSFNQELQTGTGLNLSIGGGGSLSAGSLYMQGTSSTATVEGAGSQLRTTGLIAVGYTGTQNLAISNGGSVTSGVGYIGFNAFNNNAVSNGTVVVNGVGSTWSNQFLVVGGTAARGSLTVSNGARVTSAADSTIGYANGVGVVTVDGAGSGWTIGGDLTVGLDGAATVNLLGGGSLSAGTLRLAQSAGSVGTLNVGTGGGGGILNVTRADGGAGTAQVNFNHVDDLSSAAAFTGNLSLRKQGTGLLRLDGSNTFSGPTQVAGGTLRAGATNAFSPASAHAVASGATLDLAGFSQTVPSLSNSGTVSTAGSSPGTTLTVTGPYVGNNGVLRLGTALGDSFSATDRLVLDGPAATVSGSTAVQIANLGGLGAATVGNGIEVIAARNGATTTAQSTQDAFTLSNGTGVTAKGTGNLQATTAVGGHVDAGAYEYRLYAADANGAGESWYLRSTVTLAPIVPAAPSTPSIPSTPAASTALAQPGITDAEASPRAVGAAAMPPSLSVPAYRVDVPLYAALPAQLRQGSLAMLGNLHQRVGDDQPLAGDGTAGVGRRAWGRVISTSVDIAQNGTVSPRSSGRLNGFQAGTDLYAAPHWRTGVYVGQLDGDASVSGFASGQSNLAVGLNDLRSRYLGVYATYLGDAGWYADATLQGGRHDYSVRANGLFSGAGRGRSTLASIEVGKAFDLGESAQWKIEPSVQFAHQRLTMDDSAIAGATVRQADSSGWIARAGVRVRGQFDTGAGRLQPYARVNLHHASNARDTTRFIGPAGSADIASASGGSSAEAAGGFTLALSEQTSIYGELGKLWAVGGDARIKSGIQGNLGLKVRW